MLPSLLQKLYTILFAAVITEQAFDYLII